MQPIPQPIPQPAPQPAPQPRPTTPPCLLIRNHDVLVRQTSAGPTPIASPPHALTPVDDFILRPHPIRILAFQNVPPPSPHTSWLFIRDAFAAKLPWAHLASRAIAFLHFRRLHRHCGVCGAPLHSHPSEIALLCPACHTTLYPDPIPAVIVRIEKNGKILLARHAYRTPAVWACIAGHVEAGESAEDCVHREVREETGLEIDSLRYVGSQHWPFPNQLMLAYTARWRSGTIRLQPDELLAADWFDPSHLPASPPQGSIAWRLLHNDFPPTH